MKKCQVRANTSKVPNQVQGQNPQVTIQVQDKHQKVPSSVPSKNKSNPASPKWRGTSLKSSHWTKPKSYKWKGTSPKSGPGSKPASPKSCQGQYVSHQQLHQNNAWSSMQQCGGRKSRLIKLLQRVIKYYVILVLLKPRRHVILPRLSPVLSHTW